MKKNSEKIILAASAVLALGASYLGYAKITAIEEDFAFSSNASQKNDATIMGATELESAVSSIDKPLACPIALIGEKKRPVDLFVGVPLFAKKPSSATELPKPIDPLLDSAIHEPIPNTWWLEFNMKSEMVLSDGPSRDYDGDGFSNLDEYTAKTNPSDVSSYPELADKVEFVKYEAKSYFLWFTMAIGPEQYEFKITELPAKFETAAPAKQADYLKQTLPYARTEEPIPLNTNIFQKITDEKWAKAVKSFPKDRFELKKVENMSIFNAKLNDKVEVEVATILDKKSNKMDSFQIPRNPIDRPSTVRYDRSAVLALNAAGEANKTFTVEENTKFALPATSNEKQYLLKEVHADKIVIEYKSKAGEVKSRTISRNP